MNDLLTVYNLKPKAYHINEVRVKGNNSFCNISSIQFMAGVPVYTDEYEEWTHAFNATLFKMNEAVELHKDDYVGKGKTPELRRALFWYLDKNPSFIFITKDRTIPMEYGDWIVFDDSRLHGVKSEGMWYGAAWQLKPAVPQNKTVKE